MVLVQRNNDWHYLKRPKRVHLPGEVVCLQVTSTRLAPGGKRTVNAASGFELLQFVECKMVSWRWVSGEITRYKEETFHSAKLVIDRLISLSKGGKSVTIFSLNSYDTVNLLRVWQWFDNGTLSFGVNPGGEYSGKGGGKGRKWKGVCILENPPNILHCRCRWTKGRLKFVGLENYGITGWNDLHKDKPDVSGVYAFVVWYYDLLKRHDLGSWCNTSGSQAMHSYRRSYMDCDILVHRNSGVLELERESYYSGRVECRVIGSVTNYMQAVNAKRLRHSSDDKIYCVDVNSMYTHVATTKPVPIGLIGLDLSGNVPSVPYSDDNIGYIADVTVKCERPAYPYRLKFNDGRLPIAVHPTGTFRTCLCGPELNDALFHSDIVKVHKIAQYKLGYAFRSWGKFASIARLECASSFIRFHSRVIKSILVNLYGKFGQWRYLWEKVANYKNELKWEVWTEQEKGTKPLRKYRTIGGKTERECDRTEHGESVPAIAAWVTSLGRVHLARLVNYAGWHNVYYMDTDSVWTNSQGLTGILRAGNNLSGAIGDLKVSGEYDAVQFFGLKNYIADGKRVCSGLTDGFVIHNSTQAAVEEPVDFEAALSLGKAPEVEQASMLKAIARKFRHGTVMPDYSVRPLRIVE